MNDQYGLSVNIPKINEGELPINRNIEDISLLSSSFQEIYLRKLKSLQRAYRKYLIHKLLFKKTKTILEDKNTPDTVYQYTCNIQNVKKVNST
jgi:hypothetical protein